MIGDKVPRFFSGRGVPDLLRSLRKISADGRLFPCIEVMLERIDFLAREFERGAAEQQTQWRCVGQRSVNDRLRRANRIARLIAAARFRLLAALAGSLCISVNTRRRLLDR